ncbi:hypothetical protein Tco_0536884, partial [Tanacetum coccineum]
MLVGMTIPVVFFNLGFLWYFKHIKHRREDAESFKDVQLLKASRMCIILIQMVKTARPPCFDLSSFVKKIALLSQFEHGKIARYYGADK